MLDYIKKLLDNALVEWKPLGEVTEYEQPDPYLVQDANYKDCYTTPVLTAGKSFILGYTYEQFGIYPASLAPVIIFDDFTTASRWVDFDFKVKSSAVKMLTSKDESLYNLRFIYFWLQTIPNELTVSDHKRQWISNYAQKLIPIPPMHVQEEIARILDKFTELEHELEHELELRKKQYTYYRDHLLTFPEGKAEWKPLEEVFEMRNGYTPSKKEPEYWTNGTIPWYRMEDIRTSGRFLSDSIQHITPIAVKKSGLFKAGSIIMATTATIGEHALLIADSLANQRFTNFKIRESLSDSLDAKFVYYYFFIICEWCKQNVNVGSFASVDMELLKEVPFPIPPMEEQERIVGILDKFERLTGSITEGLPREIELRRKQYEYYRDQLLDFPKISPALS